MPRRKNITKELEVMISRLQQERQDHLDALADIDSAFAQFGIEMPKRRRKIRKKVGRPRKTKKRVAKKVAKRKKRTQRRFKVSGPELILNFVGRAGKNGVSGSEIVEHWKSKGRAGEAYTVIGKLVKAKQLKKRAVKGQRGSRYAVA